MIFIVVKFETRPEWSDRWLDLVAGFTAATRAEPHVTSAHFAQAMEDLPQALVATPRIINTTIEGASGWSLMGELRVE